MRSKILLLATMLAFTSSVWAEFQVLQKGIQLQPMQKPPAREVGYEWKALKDGKPYTAKTVKQTESTVIREDNNGCQWVKQRGSFLSPAIEWKGCGGNDGTATVTPKGTAWPLQVGREWSFYVNGGNWQTNRACEVKDAVRVKIALGEYDTFKIVCDDKWNTRTYFYAPVIRTTVFYERHRRKKGKRNKFELTE